MAKVTISYSRISCLNPNPVTRSLFWLDLVTYVSSTSLTPKKTSKFVKCLIYKGCDEVIKKG